MARNKKPAVKKSATGSSGVAKHGSVSPTGMNDSELAAPVSLLRNDSAAHSPETQEPRNGTNRPDTAGHRSESTQGGSQKNGKNGAKVPPLPAGFLESELTMHKRKLKTAEHVVQTCRQEIANLKGQIADATQENRELHEGKLALEQWKAAQEQIVGAQNSSVRAAQWTALCVSMVAVGAAAAVALCSPSRAH